VKILFDENLSSKLVVKLAELFPGSIHVKSAGLEASPDLEIWDFAGRQGFLLVTTDADFCQMATTLGPPPKLVWLRRWHHPTRDAEELLRHNAVRITEFAADPELAVRILDRD
jgi:predicted nuclease of predicted toxin-antitoxin system